MSKEKEGKIFKLIGLCFFLLVLFVAMLVMILSGYLSDEIIEFGRRPGGTHELSEDKSNYWFNLLAWGGFLIFFAGISAYEIAKQIKDIRNS